MNRLERRAAEPILDRFKDDIDAGRFRLRYDSAADILTMVIYRPENPVTFQDPSHGTFVDFDVDEKRISALTIMRFRSVFLRKQLHEGTFQIGWRRLLAFRSLALLDSAASKAGFDLSRFWTSILAGKDVSTVIRGYREALRNDPDSLVGFGRMVTTG